MTGEQITLPFTVLLAETGILRYAPTEHLPDASELIQCLGRTGNVFIVANFRAFGLRVPDGLEEQDDVFSEAPPMVWKEHSLHVFAPDALPDDEAIIEALRQKGGLIVLFTKLDRAALMEELKFYWAWFARPATLRMQFEQGSEFLAEKLFSGLHAVLIEAAPGKGWIVYANPKNTPDWRAVGFPNPPIGGEG